MKKIASIIIFSFCALVAGAQVSSLDENFNTVCPVSPIYIYAHDWHEICFPHGGNLDSMTWYCTPTGGKLSTPGVYCKGYYDGMGHTDTAYLITPKLDISGFNVGPGPDDSIYIQYDTKTVNYTPASLGFMPSIDSNTINDSLLIPAAKTQPMLSSLDAANWVTHRTNISYLKDLSPIFFFTFRYICTASQNTTWFIDNVSLVGIPTGVAKMTKGMLPLTVLGISRPDHIDISFTPPSSGKYELAVYDLVGRVMHTETLDAQSSNTTRFLIDQLHLCSGMYFIKVGNGLASGTAKAVVP